MKTKVIIVVILSAIITLSFTFISSKSKSKVSTNNQVEKPVHANEPVGGLAIEEGKF